MSNYQFRQINSKFCYIPNWTGKSKNRVVCDPGIPFDGKFTYNFKSIDPVKIETTGNVRREKHLKAKEKLKTNKNAVYIEKYDIMRFSEDELDEPNIHWNMMHRKQLEIKKN